MRKKWTHQIKDKLLAQETERTVYCPDTDGLLKVSAQSEWWFPIQPPSPPPIKKGSKFQILLVFFCLKDKLLGQKTDAAVFSPDTFEGTELETKS